MTSDRDDLYRRLLEADAATTDTSARATAASRTRGALIEALVLDGASYAQIGAVLGISKQRVGEIRKAYQKALQGQGQ